MAGSSSTCGICGEVIAVEAKVLVDSDGNQFGSVIDLDAQWQAELDHYTEKHPDAELPERFW
jgi:hypothetical protein